MFWIFVSSKVIVSHASRLRLPNGCKLAINWKEYDHVTIWWHVRHRCRVSLVNFDNFLLTKFVYKGLTRNPEIGNTPAWVLPDIWRLGPVRDTKFGTNVSNKMLLNAAKCQGYSLYRFWVVNRWSNNTHLPPRVDHCRAASCKQRSPCRVLTWVECAEYNVCQSLSNLSKECSYRMINLKLHKEK